MQLGVKDVAGLLNVSEKTVYRWIDDGKLPGYRISGQYRFNRAELLAWATANRIQASSGIFLEPESDGAATPTIEGSLKSGGIHYRVNGHDVSTALRTAVSLLHLQPEVDREFLLQMLLAREGMASTGIGGGIAIPHIRNPIVLHLPQPMLSICFLEAPIDFGALDGEPVQVLFLLVCPSVKTHLQLMSQVAFALRDPSFLKVIQQQGSREQIMDGIRQLQIQSPVPQSCVVSPR
jgi:PTS system nitrogen regulatory IIA component